MSMMMGKFVDMAKDDAQIAKETMPSLGMSRSEVNRYPYGLSISLDQDDLDKLGMDADCAAGDMLHLHALAKVSSVSTNDTESGMRCRIELQITHLEVEDEDAENEEADGEPAGSVTARAGRRYKKPDAAEEAAEGEAE